ncbi:MAG TPA: SDR family NAD(P)-dependent oxidoreductase [Spirillospora sp.]|nr:SDR family NAD(P)-dependent oxidoreductase [Spirillospora sp.]
MTSLVGKVAVVTGASRGIGRGIALSLGDAGATVYVTGRATRAQPGQVPLAGTVDETAEEVTKRGGKGIAVRCDHRQDAEAEQLFQRIQSEQGRIDLLVNNAWAGYEGLHDGSDFPIEQKFWERRLSFWDDNLFGLRAAYIASVFAARMMVARGSGLIVCVSHRIRPNQFGSPAYHIAKTATDRLAAEMAHNLRGYNVTAVAIYPGLVRTEGIMKYAEYMDLTHSESPEYVGRAVTALASDPAVFEKTGRALWVSDLAREYNFTDTDGTQPVPTWRYE